MTGAMYAAISGLKTHMNKLNVIGNNVANVNTYGFKAARCTFQEAIYTTTRSGSDGSATTGGRNPSQIGYGSEIRSIDLNMTSGQYAPTISSDCMIRGDGFFLVGGKNSNIDPTQPDSLTSLTLTRVGDFDFDSQGYLTDSYGNVVYGFLCTQQPIGGDEDAGTEAVAVPCLVPIRLPLADSDGRAVYPTYDEDSMTMVDAEIGDGSGDGDAVVTNKRISVEGITFDEATGKITATNKNGDIDVDIGYLALGVPANPAGVTHTNGPYYKASAGSGELTIVSLGGAVKGYIGQGPDDDPDEEGGLPAMRIGDAGDTTLYTGGLELSNADLATEIAEMITTQRGYQANTRIITVTDSMLEELVNMKR